MDFFFCFRNLIFNVGLLVQILLVLAITFQVSVFYVQQMGIKIQQGLKKKKREWKIKWKQRFLPVLIRVFVRETTQLTWTLWDVDSRQHILWRYSSLWIIQKYTKKSLCCLRFPLLLLWLETYPRFLKFCAIFFFFHKSGAVDASSLPCCTLLLGRGVSKFHFWVTNPLVFRPTAWVRSERVLPLLASTQAGLEISGKAFVVGLALVFVLHVASFLRLVNYPLG